MSDAVADAAIMVRDVGEFLIQTHPHGTRADETRPWLLRRESECAACTEMPRAVRLESAPVETCK